jgi:hypothetical protein
LHRTRELWSTVRDSFFTGEARDVATAFARHPTKMLKPERHPEISSELSAQMAGLNERNVSTLMLLSLGEPIADDILDAGLDANDPWAGVTVERIPIRDHMFRPTWAQAFVHDALDRGLDRARDAASEPLART